MCVLICATRNNNPSECYIFRVRYSSKFMRSSTPNCSPLIGFSSAPSRCCSFAWLFTLTLPVAQLSPVAQHLARLCHPQGMVRPHLLSSSLFLEFWRGSVKTRERIYTCLYLLNNPHLSLPDDLHLSGVFLPSDSESRRRREGAHSGGGEGRKGQLPFSFQRKKISYEEE